MKSGPIVTERRQLSEAPKQSPEARGNENLRLPGHRATEEGQAAQRVQGIGEGLFESAGQAEEKPVRDLERCPSYLSVVCSNCVDSFM